MELIKAIKTIKKECEKHGVCAMCPLRTDNNYCTVRIVAPDDYKLKSKKDLNDDDPTQRIFA